MPSHRHSPAVVITAMYVLLALGAGLLPFLAHEEELLAGMYLVMLALPWSIVLGSIMDRLGMDAIVFNELAAAAARMATLYKQALATLPAAQCQELQTEQRGWLTSRNDCGKIEAPENCISYHYQQRSARLEGLLLEHASPGATRVAQGILVTYQCEDNSEIIATFIQGDPGSAQVERGDSQWTLPLVPAGSGAKYSDGRVTLWTKGDEALFERDGKEVNCKESSR